MMGRGLAATKETPIKPHFENGELVVGLRGMGSEDAMRDNGSARYSSSAPEGVSTTLTYRGSVVDIMEKYIKYLRAGLEYVGAPNIEQHRLYTNFDVREGAGRIEAGPHDI
jgi:IMP dehydrogenase/GMP reductase